MHNEKEFKVDRFSPDNIRLRHGGDCASKVTERIQFMTRECHTNCAAALLLPRKRSQKGITSFAARLVTSMSAWQPPVKRFATFSVLISSVSTTEDFSNSWMRCAWRINFFSRSSFWELSF